MTPNERRQFQEMYAFFQQMRGSRSIELPNDRALRDRFKIDTLRVKRQVPTDTTNMTKAVNEEGTSSYSVMNVPDEVGNVVMDDGLTYLVALYNP